MSITSLPAAEIVRAVARREISAEETARAFLDRIAARDGTLGAFITVDAEGALAAARAADAAVARGEPGALAGLPVAVKDNLCTRGLKTTCASRILADFTPPYDATAVALLREAGAVILGKTNLDEFAMGSTTETSAFGPTRNPWDPARVPGGSSGGSAAAVGAGLTPVALGSDTGGSIRQPASFCGCVGMKPTYGRVSRSGLVAFASSLDQVGPIAADVSGAALVLQAIAGYDPLDSTSSPRDVPDYAARLAEAAERPYRVGVPREYFGAGLDPEVAAAVRRGIGILEKAGCEIREVSFPSARFAIAAYYAIATAEASSNLARYDGVAYGLRERSDDIVGMYAATRRAGFGAEVKRRIVLGTYALSLDHRSAVYEKAMRVRGLIARELTTIFEGCDLVAGPVFPGAPYRLGETGDDPLAVYLSDIYTIPANLAGIPAISVPCGVMPYGLPVGLQLMAPRFGEESLLGAALVVERGAGFDPRPAREGAP